MPKKKSAPKKQSPPKKKAVKKTAEPSKASLRAFARKCMLWTDRNGKVLDRGSSPFSAWLQMEYKADDFHVFIKATQSPYSNGYCLIEVKVDQKLVFKAEGDYIGGPYFKTIQKYVSGTWRKRFANDPTS